ncbi:MAG: hypothetical protein ACRDJP_10220, partial [Actinomycetota bacterium]
MAVLATVTPLLFRIGYLAIFSRWYPYDDEGYLLVSLRSHMSGDALYDDVFSQYGPFYYQLMGLVFRLAGALPTHDGGRLLTLSLWLLTSALGGFGVYLITRRLLLAVGTQALVFLAASTVANEPMHPGGILCLLLAGLVAAVATIPRSSRAGWFAAGALASGMAFIKVNVGGLALIALLITAIISSREEPWLRIAAIGVFVATPFALMARDLGEPYVLPYAFVVASSALGLAAVSLVSPRSPSRSSVRSLLTGAVATSFVIVAAALLQGTDLASLFDGVLLAPLGQRQVFTLPMVLPAGLSVWAGVGMVFAVVAARLVRGARLAAGDHAVAVLRIAGGTLMWLAVGGVIGLSVPAFALALPLAWVILLPGPEGASRVVRLGLATLAVLQALHGYPVAGSQTSWSGLLCAPLGAVAIADGLTALANRAQGRVRLSVRASGVVLILGILGWLVLGPISSMDEGARISYFGAQASGLPGAERLRLAPETAEDQRHVVSALRSRCHTFYSWPGLN